MSAAFALLWQENVDDCDPDEMEHFMGRDRLWDRYEGLINDPTTVLCRLVNEVGDFAFMSGYDLGVADGKVIGEQRAKRQGKPEPAENPKRAARSASSEQPSLFA